jgi:hypothetical protein
MSPLTEIILAAIASGIISTIVFIAAGAVVAFFLVKHMEIFFLTSGSPYTIPESIVSFICILIVLASFFICPFTAYKIRKNIFEFTGSDLLRIVLFALVGSAQLIIFTSVYYSVVLYRNHANAPYTALHNALIETGFTVAIQDAKFLRDENKFTITEVKLRVENIPDMVTYYSIARSEKGYGGFHVNLVSGEREQSGDSWIKASKENDRWVFREFQSGNIIPDENGAITLRFKHERLGTTRSGPPSTLPIKVIVYERAAKGYPGLIAFSRPIPITLER